MSLSGNNSSVDSNQSPPSSSSSREVEVQTDLVFESEMRVQDDFKKDKYKDELLRINAELRQCIDVQKAKIRASKETIKNLLVQQSRMERKQVIFVLCAIITLIWRSCYKITK